MRGTEFICSHLSSNQCS